MRGIKLCPVMLFDFFSIGSNFNQDLAEMFEVNPSDIQKKTHHSKFLVG